MKNKENINQGIDDDIDKNPKSGELEEMNIFSKSNLKAFFYTTLGLFGIIGIYYLTLFLVTPIIGLSGGMNMGGTPTGGAPTGGPSQGPTQEGMPHGGMPPPGSGTNNTMMNIEMGINIWPFWGTFSVPSVLELMIFAVICLSFIVVVKYYFGNKPRKVNPYMLVLIGTLLIICTNLISGWEEGIVNAIGGTGEIYQDAIQITDPISFISEYTILQDNLTVHARTHPPGAILVIYFLYILFGSAGYIAIAICVISALLSAYFLNGIFKRYFSEGVPKYMVFLYLLLPAIQVYYLANIYALITTLIIGVVYFYFHENKIVSIIGTITCSFLATLMSFMAFFIIGCLLFYEVFSARHAGQINKTSLLSKKGFKNSIKNSQRLIISIIGIVGIYGILLLGLGFNYLNSFFIATAAETTQGWELITNPFEYFTTRVKNVMDILMFFGPVMIVLFYKGFKMLKTEKTLNENSAQLFHLVSAAILTLLLVFASGAYDHGETARAAMFIYLFLLIPVAIYLNNLNGHLTRAQWGLLFGVVFGQAVFMQLVGSYVW